MPRRPPLTLVGVALALAALTAPAVTRPTVAADAAADGEGDPGRGRQWGLDRIGAPEAWRTARGEGITIAVVDSGIDADHPDLGGQVDGRVDCVGHDDLPGGCLEGAGDDEDGHGTHVAGIAAASTDNGIGIAGVAPRARLLSIRALSRSCDERAVCEPRGTEADVAQAVRWAADHGAHVVNLSIGGLSRPMLGPGSLFRDAVDHAWAAGAVPVLATGDGQRLDDGAGSAPVVFVLATTADDGAASYSQGVDGAAWSVAAPGGEADTPSTDAAPSSCSSARPEGILSTFVYPATGAAGYACIAGTSMAAPHVAGALAVLRSAGLDQVAAVDRLLATAEDLGPPGPDRLFGAGRVDLARAVGSVTAAGGEGIVTEVPGDVPPVVAAPPGHPVLAPGITTPPVSTSPTAPDRSGRGGDVPVAALVLAVVIVLVAATFDAWRGRRSRLLPDSPRDP